MAKVSNSFGDSFPPGCQQISVPIQLQIMCSLIIDGCDPRTKGFSQSALSISQIIMHQYQKTSSHDITANRRHSKHRETPVPIYIALKLYATVRAKTFIKTFFPWNMHIL